MTSTEMLKLAELALWAGAAVLLVRGLLFKSYGTKPEPEAPVGLLAMVCILMFCWGVRSILVGNANPTRGRRLALAGQSVAAGRQARSDRGERAGGRSA